MRTLTTLPGKPTVVVACHPTKAADPDRLLPRGGGAFVNEMDGNLTGRRRDGTIEIYWYGKIRGADFEPLSFRLEEVTVEALKDSKGRPIPSVMAVAMSEEEVSDHQKRARDDNEAILHTVNIWKDAQPPSLTDLAVAQGWMTPKNQPNKSRARHAVDRLIKAKLLRRDDLSSDLELTENGKKAANKL
jgi:hypothetical protein